MQAQSLKGYSQINQAVIPWQTALLSSQQPSQAYPPSGHGHESRVQWGAHTPAVIHLHQGERKLASW